jgi:hypothetical protein
MKMVRMDTRPLSSAVASEALLISRSPCLQAWSINPRSRSMTSASPPFSGAARTIPASPEPP